MLAAEQVHRQQIMAKQTLAVQPVILRRLCWPYLQTRRGSAACPGLASVRHSSLPCSLPLKASQIVTGY